MLITKNERVIFPKVAFQDFLGTAYFVLGTSGASIRGLTGLRLVGSTSNTDANKLFVQGLWG
jgi:hypothetical protein